MVASPEAVVQACICNVLHYCIRNCEELRPVLALFDGLQENKGPTGKNDSK